MTEYDFEGRCVKCHRRLGLTVKVMKPHEVVLSVNPCKVHPEDSFILWPQRDDLTRIEEEVNEIDYKKE